MRTIVLAGGYAKRLWPLTLEKPKPLLPLGDGCILDYIIPKIMKIENLSEIIISTNKKFEKNFLEWIKERGYKNLTVITEPSMKEEEKPGPIIAVWNIAKNVRDDYLIVAGDNVFSLDLREMASFFYKVKLPVVALFEIDKLESAKNYACVILDDNGSIIEFEEKPKSPKSCLISTCIYMLPWRSMILMEDYLKSNPPDPIGKFIEWLVNREKVYGFKFKGYWYDIGDYEMYNLAKEAFKKLSYKDQI
ncbi:MAG: nucleotidyltransferase family protein [Candidatus Methanomethyliaceae archaeon]|nr:nucleotidyltransferase family protein [Candidatus Methanomethyliaceae archaeon]MDW7970277.1 nucleotidyltransferase family protein [Nitrososphaerota archaeon]